MDDKALRQFSQAVLSSIQNGDTNAGTGDAVVNNFARSNFGDILAKPAEGVGTFANAIADRQAQEAEAARKAEIQRLQDKLDPNKYQKLRKSDGGFDFVGPDGQPISVQKYAQIKGTNAAYELKDSENPFDLQYVNDYKNTRELVTAIQNGDTDTIQAFKASNGDLGKMTPEQLMQELIRKYPHIYGNGQYSDSYKNNNNPLIRMNLGMAPTSAGGTNDASNNYGFNY